MTTRLLAILSAAALAGTATAADPAPPGGDGPRPYAGTVTGSVRQLNLARGTITVQSGEGPVTFNADPGQLAPLGAGDRVAFSFVSYEGALWLAPEATRGEIGKAPAEETGTATGSVRRLGRAEGTITVRGVTYRIHPSRLEGLVPGQLVAITFARHGPASWVADVKSLGFRAKAPEELQPVDPAPEDE